MVCSICSANQLLRGKAGVLSYAHPDATILDTHFLFECVESPPLRVSSARLDTVYSCGWGNSSNLRVSRPFGQELDQNDSWQFLVRWIHNFSMYFSVQLCSEVNTDKPLFGLTFSAKMRSRKTYHPVHGVSTVLQPWHFWLMLMFKISRIKLNAYLFQNEAN